MSEADERLDRAKRYIYDAKNEARIEAFKEVIEEMTATIEELAESGCDCEMDDFCEAYKIVKDWAVRKCNETLKQSSELTDEH